MNNNKSVSLDDRYKLASGRVLLSGIQALVRLPLDQMRRDKSRDLNTGVFISGYRGSPLGGYDLQLTRNKTLLEQHNIHFQPGVNEELGATAVWGTQQVNLFEGATVDGVCGIWYGKTPGVDRSTDAFRHGNAAGSSALGGVLVVAGDDHGCKSSSYPGQSEFAFVDMHMPVLNPANVQEVLDYGLFGIELSRFSGCWVALITLTENMDSAATVNLDIDRISIDHPDGVDMPDGGLNIRVPDSPLEQEERLWRYKRPAALAFARKNGINKIIWDNPQATLGIVTAGKGHLDLMRALELLGIDESRAVALGIRILKIGMTYPLDISAISDFSLGLKTIFVVEEKRSLVEVQLKEALYDFDSRQRSFPSIVGKRNGKNMPLLPEYGELSPRIVAKALYQLLPESESQAIVLPDERLSCQAKAITQSMKTQRTPFFCSGCPHNTSTKVPEGSRALAGIGCHYLVQTMERETYTFTQMGGEGVSWVGQAPFTKTPHVFVNLGDGTYFHSGILAIRAAVAAKVNITYKILYNDAVAMTGGQPHDGELHPDMIAQQVVAEGVRRLVWVVDDDKKIPSKSLVPTGIEFRHRDDLDAVQRELRETPGVTCILYDQACATELRRKRKRGLIKDSPKRAIINTGVCEGCGDCSVQSNCISVEPHPTLLGVKRRISQSSCNKDMSCVKGFCPSFVTVEGGRLKRSTGAEVDWISIGESLPAPPKHDLSRVWNILVTGVGGTGVVTVGALIAMAAYIEGKAVTTLDQTGLAQKGGSVYTHIRLAETDSQLNAVRIADAHADALLACDLVAASVEATCLSKLNPQKCHAVVNIAAKPTSSFVLGKQLPDEQDAMISSIDQCSAVMNTLDCDGLVTSALGDTTCANIFLMGYAFQKGLIPLSLQSLYQAIELNGVALSDNLKAFSAGRLAGVDEKRINTLLTYKPANEAEKRHESLDDIIQRSQAHLSAYQNTAYGEHYRAVITRIRYREERIKQGSQKLTKIVAQVACQLMAYKDEYEVARLYSNGEFMRQLDETFEGDYRFYFNMAPPLISRRDSNTGIPKKIRFGSYMMPCFKMLACCKGIRGKWFDPFSYTSERRNEKLWASKYLQTMERIGETLTVENLPLAVKIAQLPEQIRGYGHIKERNMKNTNAKWDSLLAEYPTENLTIFQFSKIRETA